MNKVCAIHQPNFFPWIGYFNKIAKCDVFVILDHVQQQKTGGSWGNRVKLMVSGEDKWFTAPITRPKHDTACINEIQWSKKVDWRKKLIRSIQVNYAKAPFFNENMEFLETLIRNPDENMATFNTTAITEICKHIGIRSDHLILSSTLDVSGTSNNLLIDIILKQNANAYLCGGGAGGYQDDTLFHDAQIKLIYQDFQHPQYPQLQKESFTPGLSLIDALMNTGTDITRSLLEN